MSYFNYCLNYKNQVLNDFVVNGIMNEALAYDVATEFMKTGDEFERAVIQKYGNQLSDTQLIEVLRRALLSLGKDLTGRAMAGRQVVSHQPVYNPAAPNYGDSSVLGNTDIRRQSNVNRSLNQLSGGGLGSSSEKYSYTPPSYEMEPIPPEPNLDVSDPFRKRQVAKPSTTSSTRHYVSGGGTMTFIDPQAGDLTTNQKIASRTDGATLSHVQNDLFTLDRSLVEVTERSGERINIKHDFVTMNHDNAFVLFESSRDLFDFFDQNLSTDDVTNPYFRIVKYTGLDAIHVEHDLFFSEYLALRNKLKEQITGPQDDMFYAKDCIKALIDALEKRDRSFSRPFEDFLIRHINDLLKNSMRFSNNPKMVIKITCLKDFDDFFNNSKEMNTLRDYKNFDVALVYMMNRCVEFALYMCDMTPLCVDLEDKEVGIDPYVKTRKYMSVVPGMKGVTTMDYWKHTTNDAMQAALTKAVKTKVLVAIPKLTIITNVMAPGVIKQLMGSLIKEPIVIPQNMLPSGRSLTFDNSDDKLLALINHSRNKKNILPDNLLYCIGADGEFTELKLASTLDGLTILE